MTPTPRFTIAFLLKATAATAVCCSPKAFDKEIGLVVAAFATPAALAWLAAREVPIRGEFRLELREEPGGVVRLEADGGRQTQYLTRWRIGIVGACAACVLGFSALQVVDPEPIWVWAVTVGSSALVAVLFCGYSLRRSVLVPQREAIADHLLFGWIRMRRRRWQVLDGEVVAVIHFQMPDDDHRFELDSCHTPFLFRGRKRFPLAPGVCTDDDRPDPHVEAFSRRVAELLGVPYEGYCERNAPATA
ncbi:hypothetical protein [Botrimarina sp.]|uniref:hypothetical protein n=1 Tax=Botrimarina sp. TaxID=2795802 RepID=UPI0032EC1088